MRKSKGYTLFIIEDYEAYSLMLKYKLQKNANYKILIFKTRQECLKNMILNPDIIVVDYRLTEEWERSVVDAFKTYSQKFTFIILSVDKQVPDFITLMKEDFEYVNIIKEDNSTDMAGKLHAEIENIISEKETKQLIAKWGQILFILMLLTIIITIICWAIY